MHKEIINSDQAPAAIGAYVQAVQVGDFIYTSGQAGLDPTTGKLVAGGVEAQAKQTMSNLAAVLEAAGSSFANVIKTTIFLRFIKDFAAVNQVYASCFDGQFPARSTVAVSALPMTALVEIEMVALVTHSNETGTEETSLDEKVEDSEESQTEDTPRKKKKKRKSKGKKKKSKK